MRCTGGGVSGGELGGPSNSDVPESLNSRVKISMRGGSSSPGGWRELTSREPLGLWPLDRVLIYPLNHSLPRRLRPSSPRGRLGDSRATTCRRGVLRTLLFPRCRSKRFLRPLQPTRAVLKRSDGSKCLSPMSSPSRSPLLPVVFRSCSWEGLAILLGPTFLRASQTGRPLSHLI